MTTQYPAKIDNASTLPSVVQGVTGFNSTVINILRNAIIAIETELGVKPSGLYSTVRMRLDALEGTLNSIIAGETGSVTVIGVPQIGNAIIWSGVSWIPSNNFVGQSLSLSGLITVGAHTPPPPVSAPQQGIIYFDSTQHKFLVSENGGAYEPLGAADLAFSNDLSGTAFSQTVVGIRNIPVNLGTLSAGLPLVYDGTQWTAAANEAVTTGPLLSTSATTGVLTLNGKAVVNAIMGSALSSPSQGIIYYDATQNQFLVSQNGGAYVPLIGDNIETITPVTSGPYTVVGSDRVIMVGTLSASLTINLPASPSVGQTLFIKDQKGSAQAHFITIAGNGNTIDGNANYVLNVNYEGVQLMYGSSGFWSIV